MFQSFQSYIEIHDDEKRNVTPAEEKRPTTFQHSPKHHDSAKMRPKILLFKLFFSLWEPVLFFFIYEKSLL